MSWVTGWPDLHPRDGRPQRKQGNGAGANWRDGAIGQWLDAARHARLARRNQRNRALARDPVRVEEEVIAQLYGSRTGTVSPASVSPPPDDSSS